MKRTPLRKQGKSPVSKAKRKIQELLREIGIIKDGGCILRHFPVAGKCGGYRKDGELILQAEHLITRAKSVSFGDIRNIVILCKRHHSYWKPQNSRLYWEMIEDYVGQARWKWIKKVEADQKTYSFGLWEWNKIILMLEDELRKLRDK